MRVAFFLCPDRRKSPRQQDFGRIFSRQENTLQENLTCGGDRVKTEHTKKTMDWGCANDDYPNA